MKTCLFVVVAVSLLNGALHAQPPVERTPESAITPEVKDAHRHAQFLARIKADPDIDLLFLGDSITDGWPRNGEATWLKFAPYKPANFGVGGDRTEHLLWRLENGELEGIRPKVTIIMIGTNNIGRNPPDTPEWAATGVRKVVDTVREKLPSTKILLLGVFPRGEKSDPKYEAVKKINESISKLADGGKVRYLDISKAFLDPNGAIPSEIMPDKLHPNGEGYAIWYKAMRPTLDGMMKGM